MAGGWGGWGGARQSAAEVSHLDVQLGVDTLNTKAAGVSHMGVQLGVFRG